MTFKTMALASVMTAAATVAASAEFRQTYIWHNDGRFEVKQMAESDDPRSQACVFLRRTAGKGYYIWFGQQASGVKHLSMTLLDQSTAWHGGRMQITIGNRTWHTVGTVTPSYPEQLTVIYPWNDSALAQWRGFFDAMAGGLAMTISGDGDGTHSAFAYTVSLDGSAVALARFRECAVAIEGTITPRAPARPYTPPSTRREIIL
jgi:hypothetical protein